MYVFNNPTRISTDTIRTKSVIRAVSNSYDRPLTFRTASDEQRAMIPKDELYIILDDHFKTQGVKVKSKFNNLPGTVPLVNHEKEEKVSKLIVEGYTAKEICEVAVVQPYFVKKRLGKGVIVPECFDKIPDAHLEPIIELLNKRLLRLKQINNDKETE